MRIKGRHIQDEPAVSDSLIRQVKYVSRPLQNDNDLSPLVKRIGKAPLVLLGEASHGTSDYYQWRANLSRRLIMDSGFKFIAVEGDWPDCYRLNRYVKRHPDAGHSAREVLSTFRRWPTWMWANEEVIEFAEWLHCINADLPEDQRVGFYGLDVYSFWDSLFFLASHLKDHDPSSLPAVSQVLKCFEPYGEDAQAYALATIRYHTSCEGVVNHLLKRMIERRDLYAGDGRESHLLAEQNAWIIKNAEAYYRSMFYGGPKAWNIRDFHMFDTLIRLMAHHGSGAKAIVWEHNTHIGDARHTDMVTRGEINVGQLVREHYGEENVVLVGFSSHHGSVIAGSGWEAPMQTMIVPAGRHGSWEDVLHKVSAEDKLIICSDALQAEDFLEERGHRAIGVVYDPSVEHFGNCVPTTLPRRYDALLYIDETRALRPLPVRAVRSGDSSETYPSAL